MSAASLFSLLTGLVVLPVLGLEHVQLLDAAVAVSRHEGPVAPAGVRVLEVSRGHLGRAEMPDLRARKAWASSREVMALSTLEESSLELGSGKPPSREPR